MSKQAGFSPVMASPYPALLCAQGQVTEANEGALLIFGQHAAGRSVEDLLGVSLPEKCSSESCCWVQHDVNAYALTIADCAQGALVELHLVDEPTPKLPDMLQGVVAVMQRRLSALLPSLDIIEQKLTPPGNTATPIDIQKMENYIAEARRIALDLYHFSQGLHSGSLGLENPAPLRLTAFDPGLLCREIQAQMQSFVPNDAAILCWDIPDDLPTVHWDKEQTQTALHTLLSHAASSPQIDQEIAFSLRCLPEGMRITVTNQAKLLERTDYGQLFAMRRPSTSWSIQHRMGIPLVSRFTASHQGRLALSSKDGCTTVSLTLPLQTDSGETLRDIYTEYDSGYPRHLVALASIPHPNAAFLRKNFPKTSD